MKFFLSALIFTLIILSIGAQNVEKLETKAEKLEILASDCARIADNEIRSATLLEKQAIQAAKNGSGNRATELRQNAAKRRKRAVKYLKKARHRLDQASKFRRKTLEITELSLLAHQERTLRVASWNVQNFGESKQNKSVLYGGEHRPIPEIIAAIITDNNFAVVAFQEIEGDNPEAMEAVIRYLNNGTERYRMTYPEKLGKSSNRAEYLPIVYDNTRLRMETQGMLKNVDMQRQPHYAFFSLRPEKFPLPSTGHRYFDFALVSVHLAPKGSGAGDTARKKDFSQLPRIFSHLGKKFGRRQDIIVVGDFNCDPNRRGIDKELWGKVESKYILVHPFVQTVAGKEREMKKSMVQGSRLNDNMIWKKSTEQDWTGKKGVVNFVQDQFKNDLEQARRISDHLPVWCEFYTNRDTD